MSVQPKWVRLICEKIAEENGKPVYKKRIEVRKTKPNRALPIRVLIYETKGKKEMGLLEIPKEYGGGVFDIEKYEGRGKVIGEFICDKIDEYANGEIALSHNTDETCLTDCELADYIEGSKAYFWHISDLKIYDKPKELSEFRKPCPYTDGTYCIENKCEYCGDWTGVCRCWVERPPQSWCYVEEV